MKSMAIAERSADLRSSENGRVGLLYNCIAPTPAQQVWRSRRHALETRGFRVGSWSAFPRSGEIRREGQVRHLEPKVMDVLVALWARSGEVVLRSELLDDLWGAAPLASDESLTRSISLLRKALGDSPREPTYIQTVPKRGYRAMQQAAPIMVSEHSQWPLPRVASTSA
jgi:DNA-binding winged helix-turn-helix (wHTH) protein